MKAVFNIDLRMDALHDHEDRHHQRRTQIDHRNAEHRAYADQQAFSVRP